MLPPNPTASNSPCTPNLNQLASRLIIRPQHWPARPVRFDKRQLQLRAQDPKLALVGFYVAEECEGGRVALAVSGPQIEVHECGFEGDGRGGLVDLFEVEGGDYRGGGLVVVVSARLSAMESTNTP
jgi:hypothetical protein